MKSRTNLEVEKNWKDNVRINGNEKGSTRLDVYDKDTNTVYDSSLPRFESPVKFPSQQCTVECSCSHLQQTLQSLARTRIA